MKTLLSLRITNYSEEEIINFDFSQFSLIPFYSKYLGNILNILSIIRSGIWSNVLWNYVADKEFPISIIVNMKVDDKTIIYSVSIFEGKLLSEEININGELHSYWDITYSEINKGPSWKKYESSLNRVFLVYHPPLLFTTEVGKLILSVFDNIKVIPDQFIDTITYINFYRNCGLEIHELENILNKYIIPTGFNYLEKIVIHSDMSIQTIHRDHENVAIPYEAEGSGFKWLCSLFPAIDIIFKKDMIFYTKVISNHLHYIIENNLLSYLVESEKNGKLMGQFITSSRIADDKNSLQ